MSAPKRDRVLPSAWTIPVRHTISITRVCVTGALPLLKRMLGLTSNPALSEAAADALQTLERPCV